MKKLYRVGDLVEKVISNINGVSRCNAYCKITSIHRKNIECYHEYNIITGQGELNSDVALDLVPILTTKTLSKLDDDISCHNINPHELHFVDIDNAIEDLEKEKEQICKKIDFLNKNRNRTDKIKTILTH